MRDWIGEGGGGADWEDVREDCAEQISARVEGGGEGTGTPVDADRRLYG